MSVLIVYNLEALKVPLTFTVVFTKINYITTVTEKTYHRILDGKETYSVKHF